MEHPNIYTFKHSALPPLDGAARGEIAEIDFNVSNLLLKFQGHYRALTELREILSDCLDNCDMNLNCIRIVPDDGEEAVPRAIGLTDLPEAEKQLILSTAITSTVAIKVIAGIFNCDFEQAASHVRAIGQDAFGQMTPEDIDNSVEQLAKVVRENPSGGSFLVEI